MDDFQYKQYMASQKESSENLQKQEEFKERIKPFGEVYDLESAKKLASEILPTTQELTVFYIGDAKCTVLSRENNLRISIDSNKEFICYDFT